MAEAGENKKANFFSARESSVTVDATQIVGLQNLEYKVEKNIINVNAIGADQKTGVDYGPKVITGKLIVKSAIKELDDKALDFDPQNHFQVTATLKGGGNTSTINFKDCHMIDRDFSIEVNGVGVCVYTFTATDIKISP